MGALPSHDLFGEVPVIGAADISRCETYRWTLSRSWPGPSAGQVCFIGLNPSTADALRDDPTVRRWIHFARAWGYGGFTAVNLYPFRSSSPAECRKWSRWQDNGPDWCARDALWSAENVIAREAKAAALTVACWGAGAWDLDWIEHLVEAIQTGEAPWPDLHCFAIAKDGSPVHLMARGKHRIPDDAQPKLWRKGSS